MSLALSSPMDDKMAGSSRITNGDDKMARSASNSEANDKLTESDGDTYTNDKMTEADIERCYVDYRKCQTFCHEFTFGVQFIFCLGRCMKEYIVC